MSGGISKRYRIEEIDITSFEWYTSSVLNKAEIFDRAGFFIEKSKMPMYEYMPRNNKESASSAQAYRLAVC